jgi:hypothetical protein
MFRKPLLSLAFFVACLTAPRLADADGSPLEKEALLIPFDLLGTSEFGASTTIAKLLKRDDVNGVAVAFVSSFGLGVEKDLTDVEALYEVYRTSGVVILLSVEPSAGSKAIKEVIDAKKLKMPISLTGKQWVPFQRIAKQTEQNTWPWTFYVDKKGTFVQVEQGTPHAEGLDKIAKADMPAPSGKPAPESGAEPATKKPPAPSKAPEPGSTETSKTVAELTVARPAAGNWQFVQRSEAFGEGLLLAKPFPDDAAAPASPSSEGYEGEGSEIFALLSKYEAVVVVSTLDRKVHTGLGGVMVDPGSKPQLLEAQLNILKKASKSPLKKLSQNANGSLGGLNAAILSAIATSSDGREVEIASYSVPVKKYTYVVTFGLAANAATEVRMQVDDIKKKMRFVRG